MKRAISTILFFTIIFTLSFSAIAKDDNNTIDNTIERGRVFLSKLDTLLQRYSNIEPKDTTLNLQMTDADSQTYKSSRLVVLGDSDEPLNNDFGAVEKVEGYAGLHILQYNNEDEATFAYNGLKSNSIIRYIEYDFQYYTEDTIDEAKLTASSSMDQWNCWGVNVVFSQLAMQEISDFHIETSPVVVAILDSGLNVNHNAIDATRIILPNDSDYDIYGHGTAVASIIQHNTPSNVQLYPIKVLEDNGKVENSKIVTIINLFRDSQLSSEEDSIRADIMNISINSTTGLESKIFEEAVSAVVDSGTIVVASSGNNYASAKNHPPANVKKAIVVAGSIEGNTPYSPSNRGGTVDLAAPGQDVLCADAENGKATGLILKSGTSFSAPFVSAAAAILKSIDSSLSPSEVENILKRTVTPWSGTYTSYGTGIVNFVNMLNPYRIDSPTVNVDWDTNTVTLTTPESVPNAEIYYTLDGTEPTKDTGIRYTEPIVVERRVEKIKIIACISGELPSKVVNYVLCVSA